jgi:hypothetical protein
LAHSARRLRPGLLEHRSDQPLGGVGRLRLLEPIEQFAQRLKLLARRCVCGEGMVERELLLGRCLSVQHGMHRLGQLATIHIG